MAEGSLHLDKERKDIRFALCLTVHINDMFPACARVTWRTETKMQWLSLVHLFILWYKCVTSPFVGGPQFTVHWDATEMPLRLAVRHWGYPEHPECHLLKSVRTKDQNGSKDINECSGVNWGTGRGRSTREKENPSCFYTNGHGNCGSRADMALRFALADTINRT